jgi:anti-anti-sigma factor
MTIDVTSLSDDAALVRVAGRLDAHGAALLDANVAQLLDGAIKAIVLDLSGVPYLSSAGLRVFLKMWKVVQPKGGSLALAGVQPYCRDVLELAGFGSTFTVFHGLEEAARHVTAGTPLSIDWTKAEKVPCAAGTLRIVRGRDGVGTIEVVGDIKNVLAAAITPGHVCSKPFFEKEYSIGLGALGGNVEEYLPLMGEMITLGGTMVWLPCDGNDTPDFLIPRKDTGKVTVRTGFNASLAGPFHEYAEFVSADPAGLTMNELYRVLFDQAKARRPDYKGAIGIGMRCEMGAVFGSGVLKAPIASLAPANGKWITDPSNFSDWFEFDKEPRHRNVTGLIAGVGVDLSCDTSVFTPEHFHATFYVNPANTGGKLELLHNHAVIFKSLPMPESGFTLEGEVAAVIEKGEFTDMRHLLDASTVMRAVIGMVYVDDFRVDAAWRREG